MSDQDGISQSKVPQKRNLDKFTTIIKENKNKEQERRKKSPVQVKNEVSEANSQSKLSKSKVMDNSYQSGMKSKKDPSMFKFENESESSEDEMGFKKMDRDKETNGKNEKKPKIIDINKNVVEEMRKKKEKEEKERQKLIQERESEKKRLIQLEQEKEQKKLPNEREKQRQKEQEMTIKKELRDKEKEKEKEERRDLVIELEENLNSVNRLLLTDEIIKNKYTNALNDNLDLGEDDHRHSKKFLSKDDQLDLIENLKDKQFKDEMTGLLEKSFDQHFANRRNLEEENEHVKMLLENMDVLDLKKTKEHSIDMNNKDQRITDTDVRNFRTDQTVYYSDINEDEEELKPMHLDGYNKFYKGDFYKKELFLEHDIENNMRINNKDTSLFKTRLIYNYFNEKTNVSLPKFTKVSEKDRKCQEIMTFTDNGFEERVKSFFDRCVCLEFRRNYFKLASRISQLSRLIVCNVIFDNFSLAVILINTFLILISDPTIADSIANTSDNYFLYIYSMEMTLKIFAFGFVLPYNAYLKDMWNTMDFFVVLFGWIGFILERAFSGQKISGLAGLRAFRILRPLKTVKSIKGLRSLIVTLIESMMALSDTLIVLFFFFLIFAIAGVQMWQGLFLKRCMSLNYGYFYDVSNYTTMCTLDTDCQDFNTPGNTFICAKSLFNPNNDVTHYDNTVAGLITVFIIATMEGWTDIWNYVSRTFKDQFGINPVIIFMYFHVLLFVGGYYLLNLYLAVIKTKFTIISKENKQKDENKKRSFFDLIEEKYNYKKEDKQEAEAAKNKKELKGDQALRKLKAQFNFIKRNDSEIPINYNTLKDVLAIKAMSPEEQYELGNRIKRESKLINLEYNKKVKNIKMLAKQSKTINLITLSSSGTVYQSSAAKTIVRRNNNNENKPEMFQEDIENLIEKKFIQPAINETIKWFEKDYATVKKPVKTPTPSEFSNMKMKMLKAQKKEEEKKHKKIEISVQQDTTIEIEINKMKKSEKERTTNNMAILNESNEETTGDNTKIPKSKKFMDGENNDFAVDQKNSNPGKKIKALKVKKRKPSNIAKAIGNIEDELSFYSDNTEDEIEEDAVRGKFDDSPINTNGRSNILSKQGDVIKKVSANMVTKQSVVDIKNNIVNTVTIKRPFSLISGLFRYKDELMWKKKIEEKRKKFNVDDYISQLKPVQINKIGRRRSFLKMLQYVDDKTSYEDLFVFNVPKKANDTNDIENDLANKSLEISLYHDDNILVDSKSFSDLDMIPADLPTDEKYIQDDMDFDEITKKNENNKFSRIARNSMFDRKKRNTLAVSDQGNDLFLKKLNNNMNANIIIDMKEPKKEALRKSMTRMSKAGGNMMALEETQKKDIKSGKNLYTFHKAPSVEKNMYKYPVLDVREVKQTDFDNKSLLDAALKEKKDKVADHLREKRKYYNYVFNIKDKDIHVQDKFKADYWREDVMGPNPKIINQLAKPADKNPVIVFNDSSLNLKSYNYIRYKKFEYLDDEYVEQNHALKNLGSKAIDKFPPKPKYFGMVKVDNYKRFNNFDPSRSLSKSYTSKMSNKKMTSSQANVGSNLHKNKSALGNSSINAPNYSLFQDMFKIRKGIIDKMQRKLNEFNFKTFSHYIIEDEKLVDKIIQKDEYKEITFGAHGVSEEKIYEIKQQVEKIRVYDIETNSRKYVQWSGQQVLNMNDDPDKYEEWNKIIDNLEAFDVILWKQGAWASIMQKLRYVFYSTSISQSFDFFIIAIVLLNAMTMAFDGNLLDPDTLKKFQLSNYAFNAIFMSEFVIKFIGLGPIMYFSDPFTYLDVFIIGFAILDMTTPESGSEGSNQIASQLAFLRVFRIFRVLRLTKVLRKIKAMKKIIKGIITSLENVSYIILILLIFILIFQLLGMSLLSSDPNYQSFLASFYITFQILTIENWNIVAYQLMLGNRITIIYLVVWIFLGNYILFNLFISVLLDSFDENNEDEDEEEELDAYQRKIKNMLPEIFDKHEQAEKEHRNRQRLKKMGGKKSRKNDNADNKKSSVGQTKEADNSNSMSQSNDMTSNSMSIMRFDEETDYEDEDEDDISVTTKMLKNWDRQNSLFAQNDCEFSCYIFAQTNSIRIYATKLVEFKTFDQLILWMIVLSTLRLMLDTFVSGKSSDFIFDMADIAFTVIFLFEMLSKIVAFGLVIGDGTYLKDNWNKIDFIIVCVSIIDLQGLISKYTGEIKGSSLNFLKVLRLLRLLRSLRFISHNVQLKLIITSLFDSIVPILNVLFIVLVVFFMFSIVGMNLFYDLYNTCYVPGITNPFDPVQDFTIKMVENNIDLSDTVSIMSFCNSLGGTMNAIPYYKFTNMFTSLITCYVLSNMEGWPNIMSAYNSYNKYYGIFFVCYLISVSYFFLNLFIGIMFNCFNEAWNREKKKGISNNQAAEKYWDFLKQIEFAKPEFASFKLPEEGLRRHLYMIATSKYLDNFIMLVIILNMILMAVSFEGSDSNFNGILDTINLIFTTIFISECILKLCANGIRGYFYYGWNQFDFFVVASSVVDIIVSNTTGTNSAFLKSFQIIRVLRVLRVTRVLRLVKSLKGLEKLLQTLRWSISALSNILILLLLIFCIFAIMGCYLYESIKYEDYKENFVQINEYYNLNDFYHSFLFCFRQVTGESWPDMMNELANGK
jgi:hypothetical protein